MKKELISCAQLQLKTSAKESIKRIRQQAIDWEEIFVQDTSDKELPSKIYNEPLKFNNKTHNPETITDTSPKKIHRWQINI